MTDTGWVADLLSDTVTRPTAPMRRAMAEAEVGDDVFGEDPTVRALEERVAGLLGHEAGLFAPTGSLTNQLGLRLHVDPGGEMLADALAHVVRAELGAAAVFSGITSRTWSSTAGRLVAKDALAMVTTGVGPYQVETQLVVVENTHNFGGGTIQPLTEIRALRDGLAGTGVPMHLDGARLWNAHVATGVELTAYGQLFDTVSVCLSKGLGAPVGSVLVGSAEAMARARVWRKRYGAGMRQSGILAAAGLYAVEHHLERLADDHGRARRFAEAIAEVGPYVTLADVETNIVMVDTSGTGRSAAQVAVAVGERGIRAYPSGKDRVRLVWHLDVDDAGTDAAIAAFREVLGQGAG
ncbi:MAG: low specificity L-threonine aldolase [Actinobacteria bacterium]|nr:low specificity L-threonine aldolase [Actinomycetota bacterium]